MKVHGHIPALDGLRGVAILMVLFGHLYRKSFIADSFPTITNFLGRIVNTGGYGVELFFVLSGFLITGILLDTKHETGFFKKFYMRRVLRIFPLYYGSLVLLLLLLPHLVTFDEPAQNIVRHQAWLWTYMINWPTAPWIWDESNLFVLGHFWSLSVEEHFYMLWPALVALLSKRTLCGACLGLLGLAFFSRGLVFYGVPDVPLLLQWTTIQKLDGLVIGSLIAVLARDASLLKFIPSGKTFRWLFIVVGTAVAIYIWLPRKWNFPSMRVSIELLIAVFFGLALVQSLKSLPGQWLNRLLTNKVLMSFGKYSYGLYVIHGILRPLFARVFDPTDLPTSYGLPFVYLAGYWAVTIGICYGLAFLSFNLYEKHFLAMKRFFEYRAPRQSPPHSPAMDGKPFKPRSGATISNT